jgi:hypothetical protein
VHAFLFSEGCEGFKPSFTPLLSKTFLYLLSDAYSMCAHEDTQSNSRDLLTCAVRKYLKSFTKEQLIEMLTEIYAKDLGVGF